ncbi:MAG: hypothetical protein HC837_17465, partial [Chloroflexaceae bacterium]|nr:hypothetical protein [Chloroflexaceae bacterium]
MNRPTRHDTILLLLLLLLLLVALLPRSLSLGRGLTTDEAYFWQDRSATFLLALSDGRF